MKEIGKLIELLGNWDGRNVTYNKQSDGGYMFRLGDLAFREERICSKKFGFIKWLVENDKIDLLQLDNRIALSEFNKVERVLMALSISDTPIEDLISYLK